MSTVKPVEKDASLAAGRSIREAGLLQPVASFCALEELRSVVPALPQEQFELVTSAATLPSRRLGLSRLGQVFATAFPLIVADVTCLVAVHLWAAFSVAAVFGRPVATLVPQITCLCCGYGLFGLMFGLFPGSGSNPVRMLRSQIAAVFVAGIVLLVSWALAGDVSTTEISIVACTVLGGALALPFVRSWVRHRCVRFDWWGERAVVVGTGPKAMSVFQFLQDNVHLGLRPVGVVAEDGSEYRAHVGSTDGVKFLGATSDLLSICRDLECHWAIAVLESGNDPERHRILSVCSLIPNLVLADCVVTAPNLWGDCFDAAGLNGLLIRDSLLRPFLRLTKRVVDIMGAAALLLLISPVWLAIVVTLRIVSPGPVLFRSERIGRGGRKFNALKFRTMVRQANAALQTHLQSNTAAREEWETTHKLRNDPRIIPGIGHFLRRWSLDELPQLWNVFRGDMSLVGPRPMLQDEIEKYGSVFLLYARMRPGLTGLWQVCGRNRTTYETRLHLVVYYVRNWSLWLDYYILLRTLRAVVTREGSC